VNVTGLARLFLPYDLLLGFLTAASSFSDSLPAASRSVQLCRQNPKNLKMECARKKTSRCGFTLNRLIVITVLLHIDPQILCLLLLSELLTPFDAGSPKTPNYSRLFNAGNPMSQLLLSF
jgi:hypothetical protein